MASVEEIRQFIASLPCLSRFWTSSYVSKDAQQGFSQPWLNNLTEPDFENKTRMALRKLDQYLCSISAITGLQKLGPGIRSKDLENFSSTLTEVKTAAWLAAFGCLREIRPKLLASEKESDIIIEVSGRLLYGEVWQPRVLPDEWVLKGEEVSIAVADQRIEKPKRLRTLRGKGGSQLPSEVIGIWVAHVYHTALRRAWADFFREDMAGRPNVLGVAIWTSSGSKRLV